MNKQKGRVASAASKENLMHPSYTRSASGAQDRAAVDTTAIIQRIADALRRWLRGDPVDFAEVRAAIEGVLRDEFADTQRTTRDEIRLNDE
jgi:hypothetical protein